MKPLLIGVGGRSCSGKSTISKKLEEIYEDVLHIKQDKFFKKGLDIYESPKTLMMNEFYSCLKRLKEGNSVLVPSEWRTETLDRLISPKKFIVVEGFLLYVNENITNLFDKRIFIDVSDETILNRRVKRGDSHYNTFEYTKNICIPASKRYENIQRERADIIINGNQSEESILKEVEKYLNTHNLINLKR